MGPEFPLQRIYATYTGWQEDPSRFQETGCRYKEKKFGPSNRKNFGRLNLQSDSLIEMDACSSARD